MVKIILDTKKFEELKRLSSKSDIRFSKAASSTSTVKKLVGIADDLLSLISLADGKVGKSARLIKELIRIFSA